jgi:Amt family ammonium transporter
MPPIKLDSGNTAWMIAATALVLLMTPGLAFFYGGMVRGKNVLAMLMQNFICMAIVSVLWVLFAFSLAFGHDVGGHGLIGDISDFWGMKGGGTAMWIGGVPTTVIASFQLTFAVITPALITGAIADRMKFGSFCVFVALWVVLVYSVIAHWVWGGGWIGAKLHAIDFAGGTVVHINAGIAGLVLTCVMGKRVGWPKEQMKPHNVPFVLLGAGLLWFGWIGFNAGSELAADTVAGYAMLNSIVATAAAMIGWLVVEKVRDGHATTLGAASGLVAGLVAITPACGFVNGIGAILLGVVAGAVCASCVGIKFKFGFDDSLDVVAVHLVGGIVGALSLGFLATHTVNPAVITQKASTGALDGIFYGGGLEQLGRQAVAVGATLAYSGIVTLIIALGIKYTMGLRVTEAQELEGLDTALHAETAYEMGAGLAGSLRSTGAGVGTQRMAEADV